MIDGTAEPLRDEQAKDSFAAKHAWDPRTEAGDTLFPHRPRPGASMA